MSQPTPAQPTFDGTVVPAFPLALLEAVRAHDRPGEILEDEDLTVSLPRRLGLTGVVETQIQRYENAQRAGQRVRLDEFVSLLRLVLRRPDAEPILRDTGHRIARWHFRRKPPLWQKLLHRAPASLSLHLARRSATRALEALRAGSAIHMQKPFTVTVDDCVTGALEGAGMACTMVSGLLEELLLLHTGDVQRVDHSECAAFGRDACAWTVPA